MLVELFLLTFFIVFFIIVALSIVYSTIKVGMSPMPSSKKAYHAIVELIDHTGTGAIVDMGSGWGNFVIPIAKRYPQRQVIGYELSVFPWLTTVLLKKILGLDNLVLYRKDFLKADLSNTSVLVCYLHPEAMYKIERKLLKEKPDVGYLISNNFALPTWKSDKVAKIADFYKSPIYLYKINEERMRAG